MVDKKEDETKEKASFEGLRAPVTASSLLDSNIIDKATFDQLQQGKKTPKEVSETDKVRKYLQGMDHIVGITMEDSNEKLSIYHKKALYTSLGVRNYIQNKMVYILI